MGSNSDKWIEKHEYNTRAVVGDVFYVHDDNNLENRSCPDQSWKVRLIGEEFRQRIFGVEDV